MPRADPWEIARALYLAVEAVERAWKVDHDAPGYYVRLPRRVVRLCEAARRDCPAFLRMVHRTGNQDVVVLTDAQTLELRDAVDQLLAHSMAMSADAAMVTRKDWEALKRARTKLRLLDEAETA